MKKYKETCSTELKKKDQQLGRERSWKKKAKLESAEKLNR